MCLDQLEKCVHYKNRRVLSADNEILGTMRSNSFNVSLITLLIGSLIG